MVLNKVYKIDCIKGLLRLSSKGFKSDIIIIDPPYNIGKDFGNNKDKRDIEDYKKWSKKWISLCVKILKPTGTMFIYGFSEILAELFPLVLTQGKRWIIWHYTNKNVPTLNFWQRSHESLICCYKESPIFNRDEVREPYTECFLKNAAGKERKQTKGRFSNGKKTIYKAHNRGALPRDVIKIPALAGGAGLSERWFLCKTCNKVYPPRELREHENHEVIKHPTQKPLKLSEILIKSSKPKKDGVVLIPFVGSGSECVAAKKLGMNFIGFEINPDYIKISEERLKRTLKQKRLG